MKVLRQGSVSLARMLAEDPVFKRMSLYDRQGRLLSASHADEAAELPEDWLRQLQRHVARYGFKPFLPSVQPPANRPPCPTGTCPSCCR